MKSLQIPRTPDTRSAPAFAHITVPVDGSTASERGVAFALELARGGGAVTFCSVVDPTMTCLPAAGGALVDPRPMLAVLDEDAAVFCARGREEAQRLNIVADVQVLHGQCVSAITALVRRNGSDALVIGTHGRTGLARAFLGSVAEGVIQRSDVPVVAVHEDDDMRTGPIAVAFDASEAAATALLTAAGIAEARGMRLLLVHACENPVVGRDLALAMLEEAAQRVRARGLQVETLLRDGGPAHEISQAADDAECCMIVIGTHGRNALGRLMLGSVAAATVQRARVPVVTVRQAG